jgi:hypothetical protein
MIGDRLTAIAGLPPTTADDYAHRAADMAAAVLDIESLYRALFATRAGRASHQRSSHRRRNDIEEAFAAEMAVLDDRQAALFGAVVHLVTSSNGVLFLKDYWDLGAADAGRVVRWATEVLTDAVRDSKKRRRL